MTRRQWTRIVAVVLTIATTGFVIAAVIHSYADVRTRLSSLSWATVVGAGVLTAAAVVAGLMTWWRLLTDLGSPMRLRDASGVFFVGQLGKYLPGGLWPVLVQARLGRSRHVRPSVSAAAAALTLAMSLIAALLIALVSLPSAAGDQLGRFAWIYLLLPVGLVLLRPALLTRLFNAVLLRVRREPLPQALSARGVASALGWSCVQWLLIGFGTVLLIQGVGGHGGNVWPLGLGTYGLAWAGGFVVVFVPAGAGIRETIVTALLDPVLPVGAGGGLAVALVLRLLLTLADIAWGMFGLFLLRGGRSAAAREQALDAVEFPLHPGA